MKNTIIVIMALGLLVLAGCAAKIQPSAQVREPSPAETAGGQQPRFCTMEYMPVCGIDGVTYGNKCQAGDVPIAYSGVCAAAEKMPPLDPSRCAGAKCPVEPVAQEPVPPEETQPLLGGDRDEHGCIGSAGYSWCELRQKCIRPWEEQC